LLFATIVGILLLICVLSPFWFGPGGALAVGSAISDPEKLREIKRAILKRYLLDEASEANGHLSKKEWQQKRQFLVNRYIDASRRADFLRNDVDSKERVGGTL
jgi:hypothetical protein